MAVPLESRMKGKKALKIDICSDGNPPPLPAPLTIGPGPVVEIRPLPTHDVQAPARREVLELVVLAGRLRLLGALLLHGNQT